MDKTYLGRRLAEFSPGIASQPITKVELLDENGDVVGTLPDGKQVSWRCFDSTCPNRGYKRVMVNCYWWRAEWEN